MIATKNPVCIDGESLQEWLVAALRGLVPTDAQISMIPRSWEAHGESRFFATIDVDSPITLPDLVARVASEHSRAPYLHFYADDVVAAACGAGELPGTYFWLYHTW